jgi:plastocyanin
VDGAALQACVAEAGAEARLGDVPMNRPPWRSSEVRVSAGEQVTWLAWGVAHLLKPLGAFVPVEAVLGVRVAGGAVQRSARPTHTFTADRDGVVELGPLFPAGGEVQRDGTVKTDRLPYRLQTGALAAVVARWPSGVDPAPALASVADRDVSGLSAAESERLADPPAAPPGWQFHPLLSPAEIFSASASGIATHCRQNGGIVQRPAEAALSPTLRLRWSWRVDELPSALPEDTLVTHDYISVALEFDDGRDLTWQWSCSLPVGFAYPCPLDHWRHRETHVVVRSGSADLGRWVDEERPVLGDHRAAIGGPQPTRVVRAWLITVSAFQRSVARAEFGRMELIDGDHVVRIL